jgi:hypothetical protein
MRIALRSLEDRAIEWFAALVMLWFGANMAMPGDMLASPRFRGFQQWAFSEGAWAAILIGFALARLVALYVNGRRPKTPYIRVICAVVGFLVYAWIAQGLAAPLTEATAAKSWMQLQSEIGPGWGVYQLLAFFELFSIYRAMKDSRYTPPYHRGSRNDL